MFKSKTLVEQQKILDNAESYNQWQEAAAIYDEMSGATAWRKTEQTRLYDFAQVRQRLEKLRTYRLKQDNHGLLYTLNEGIHGNMDGMGKPKLYQRAKLGTKHLIEEYVEEVASALTHIAALPDDEIDFEEKYDFFHRASLCYGRSALMLSGGGSLGHFHLGVIKALMEQNLVPHVLSGSSAGSFVSAIFGTRTTEQMHDFLLPRNLMSEARAEANWFNKLFFEQSPQIDIHDVEEAVNRNIPNLTFQEAFELTGYCINISIAPAEINQSSRLLNAITSPNVYIRKAVMASCAVPGVYPPVMLEAKNVHGDSQPYLPTRKWIDGSFSDDLPAKRLARLYGINHYIGSLINPIVMFSNDDSVSRGNMAHLARQIGHKSVSGWTKAMHHLSQRYASNWPKLNLVTTLAHSVFEQNYEADIAIYPDFKNFNMRKILRPLNGEELLSLVRQGERSTWAKMAMISTCSRIGRVLDDILAGYEENGLQRLTRRHRRQIAAA